MDKTAEARMNPNIEANFGGMGNNQSFRTGGMHTVSEIGPSGDNDKYETSNGFGS